MLFGIHAARQAEAIDVVLEADPAQQIDQNEVELILVLGPREPVIDPSVMDVLDRVARAQGLGDPPRGLPGILFDRLVERAVAKAVDKVFANAARKENRVHPRIGHPAPGHRGGQVRDIVATDRNLAAVPGGAAGQDARHHAGRGTAVGDNRYAGRQVAFERCMLENDAAMDVGHLQFLRDERADEAHVLLGLGHVLDRQEPFGREMLHNLIILHLHVEPLLIPIDQLFQWGRQLPIGADHGHQLTDVEPTPQREISADRVE